MGRSGNGKRNNLLGWPYTDEGNVIMIAENLKKKKLLDN